jgi:hypothetical protein
VEIIDFISLDPFRDYGQYKQPPMIRILNLVSSLILLMDENRLGYTVRFY